MSDATPRAAGPQVTRFAPSPTGLLHLGHAYSALFAARAAAGGRFLLRIEDIDSGRCRPQFEEAIFADLRWLGLDWETPVRRQSRHMADYARALDRLRSEGLLYPCFCSRAEIRAEIARAGGAPHGPFGAPYPGTCRRLSPEARDRRRNRGESFALRLDMARAVARAGPMDWIDRARGRIRARPDMAGDVVLARKDVPASYHLAVTVDDHLQGVTLVTRGEDLFDATHIHRLLQALLGLDRPAYHHHPLIRDADDKRLAKRDRARSLQSLRAAGHGPDAVRRMAGFDD